ncbi:type II toxin-antitoxin system HicB family antitoxin [Desulfobacter vibrioformis]|uniref:type II toxin-antitoxin system HicB family antitoxin n=1 Tax=Desulfobacter vibrioformis TaxID=34031 RepID=UPI00054F6716|nr:type II toxin-antitoxin system HicB family antitoxin [Desulfobacter vibrioformis]
MKRYLTAIIEKEGSGYVSLCPELDIASQGETVSEARENLQEALELFFECASPEEIETRLKGEIYITQMEVAVG